jgi:hypothetical protein
MKNWRLLWENIKNRVLSVLAPRGQRHEKPSEEASQPTPEAPQPTPEPMTTEVSKKQKRRPAGKKKKVTRKKAASKGAKALPKGIADWMEKAGVSLADLAEMTGYDKSTIWHALHDREYRKRLSWRFWGKLGAAIRLRVKPKLQELEQTQKRVLRCPKCKAFFTDTLDNTEIRQ